MATTSTDEFAKTRITGTTSFKCESNISKSNRFHPWIPNTKCNAKPNISTTTATAAAKPFVDDRDSNLTTHNTGHISDNRSAIISHSISSIMFGRTPDGRRK
jgi:hypothetical protein